MKTLTIHFDPDTRFCSLTHPYNKRFVAYISQGIKPLAYRRFDDSTKRWEVHVNKIPQVVTAAKRYFEHVDYRAVPPDIQIKIVQFMEKSGELPARHSNTKSPHEVLYVATNAPPEVIKAAYRALAQKHHPDHGGDSDKFREIDAAYKALKII